MHYLVAIVARELQEANELMKMAAELGHGKKEDDWCPLFDEYKIGGRFANFFAPLYKKGYGNYDARRPHKVDEYDFARTETENRHRINEEFWEKYVVGKHREAYPKCQVEPEELAKWYTKEEFMRMNQGIKVPYAYIQPDRETWDKECTIEDYWYEDCSYDEWLDIVTAEEYQDYYLVIVDIHR